MRGASVLLLDRAALPARQAVRRRAHAARRAAAARRPVDPVVEDVVDRSSSASTTGSRFERRGRGPLVLMTQRRRLDALPRRAGGGRRGRLPRRRAGDRGRARRDGAIVRSTGRAPARRSSSAPTARTASPRARSGSRAAATTASRSRGTSLRPTSREAATAGRAVVELGAVAGRLRLGVPEGRPRQRRRRRLGVAQGRACASTSSAPVREYGVARRTARRPARLPAADAQRGRARRRADGRCSSATRPGSSIRSRATGCTRRSSARGSPPRPRSTCSPAGRRPRGLRAGARRGARPHADRGLLGAKLALDRFPRATSPTRLPACRSSGVRSSALAFLRAAASRRHPRRSARACAARLRSRLGRRPAALSHASGPKLPAATGRCR